MVAITFRCTHAQDTPCYCTEAHQVLFGRRKDRQQYTAAMQSFPHKHVPKREEKLPPTERLHLTCGQLLHSSPQQRTTHKVGSCFMRYVRASDAPHISGSQPDIPRFCSGFRRLPCSRDECEFPVPAQTSPAQILVSRARATEKTSRGGHIPYKIPSSPGITESRGVSSRRRKGVSRNA